MRQRLSLDEHTVTHCVFYQIMRSTYLISTQLPVWRALPLRTAESFGVTLRNLILTGRGTHYTKRVK